jgi:outer membrane lipoprotein-sorting protein
MKKKLTSFSSLLLILLNLLFAPQQLSAAAPSAESSVNKMIAALKKNATTDIVFTVWVNRTSTSGSICVSGSKFYLSTPDMKVWYDGKTQWAYAPTAKEVNITEPTTQELQQTNPLSILNGLNKSCTFRRLKASTGEEKIEVTPKKKTSDFASATITLNSSTYLPKAIAVKNAKGQVTTVTIATIKAGKTKATSEFQFKKANFPGVEVVDLR